MKLFARLFGVLSTVQIQLFTLTSGKKVGTDHLGNVYYQGKPRRGTKRARRWVIYKDSMVPPGWHGWLHHQTDAVPAEGPSPYAKPWIKEHKANMTGTDQAYLPPGHVFKGGKRDKATGDYEAWQPPA